MTITISINISIVLELPFGDPAISVICVNITITNDILVALETARGDNFISNMHGHVCKTYILGGPETPFNDPSIDNMYEHSKTAFRERWISHAVTAILVMITIRRKGSPSSGAPTPLPRYRKYA